MDPFRVVCLASVLSFSACVTDGGARREVVSLRRQVDRLRAKSIRDLRTIRDLENRIFVLEDRLQTVKAAPTPDRALPVVTRSPSPAPVPPAPPSAPPAALPEEEVEIVYEGDALVTTPARPRLGSNEAGTETMRVGEAPARRARRAAPLPDPAIVREKIAVVPLPDAPPRRPADDPVAVYRDAYASLQRRDHAAAIAAFQRFLARWPGHGYADNAQYWLGEARYDQREYKLALVEFQKVVRDYPDGNKAPDALLKAGYCYANLGDGASARDFLSRVVARFPRSDAARLAQKRLEELKR